MSSKKAGGEGKDALADYMRALNKMSDPKQPSATTGSLAATGAERDDAKGTANPRPEQAGDDSMSLYLQALNKAKGNSTKKQGGQPGEMAQDSPNKQAVLTAARGALKADAIASQVSSAADPARRSGVLRRGLDRLQNRGDKAMPARGKMAPRRIPAAVEPVPEVPLALEPAAPPRKVKSRPGHKFKPKLKFKPKKAAARDGVSAVPFNVSPISVKVGALLVSLVVGLLLQRLIYYLGDLPYALNDLGIGAAAVLPVLLILALVHPETRSDWTALLASVTAIAVTGGLGIALGISLLHANVTAMHEAGYVIQLFVHLAILTVLWGPVFLTVANLLHRMELLKLSDSAEY